MKYPTHEEQRKLVQQWDETGRELERIRDEALRDKPYDWREVDALLQLGEQFRGESRTTSGLIEMQYWFMKAKKENRD
jgi:hypothetical protein